jgi:hypothetical protein
MLKKGMDREQLSTYYDQIHSDGLYACYIASIPLQTFIDTTSFIFVTGAEVSMPE